MLTISDPRPARNCQGLSRRELLRVGGLGLLGLGLPDLLRARATASPSLPRDRSVVLLFLQGGPSHIEFFDPKMTAPEDVRSITGEVQTTLPGYTLGGTFTKMAKIMDKLAIVRSYASMNGDHSYLAVTGAGNSLKAAMSAIYTRVAGRVSENLLNPHPLLDFEGEHYQRHAADIVKGIAARALSSSPQ